MPKFNDTYLSPGRGPSPAELEKDSDFATCERCGEWKGDCICPDDCDVPYDCEQDRDLDEEE